MPKPIQDITFSDLEALSDSTTDSINDATIQSSSMEIVNETSNEVSVFNSNSNSNLNSNNNSSINSSTNGLINGDLSDRELICNNLGFEYRFGASLDESLNCDSSNCNRVYNSHPFSFIPNGSYINRKVVIRPQETQTINIANYGWSKLNYVYLKAECGEFLYKFENNCSFIRSKFLFLDLNFSIFNCEANQLLSSHTDNNICQIFLSNDYPLNGIKIGEGVILKNIVLKLLLVGS